MALNRPLNSSTTPEAAALARALRRAREANIAVRIKWTPPGWVQVHASQRAAVSPARRHLAAWRGLAPSEVSLARLADRVEAALEAVERQGERS